MSKFTKFFGTKEFYMATIAIALPIMAQSFVTSFVNLIDNIMIGSVSAIALTSVTVANKYYMIFTSALFGVTGGASIFISQFFGAKQENKCQKSFNILLSLCLIIGLIFMMSVVVFPTKIISIFTTTPEIMESSLLYIKYIAFSYVPYAISMAIIAALRAVGINKIQLKIGIITVFTNTILNFILIYGHFGLPALGVEGAAIATLTARLLECVIYLTIIIKKYSLFKLDIKGLFAYDFDLFKKLMTKTIPLTINEIMFGVGQATVFTAYMSVNEYLVSAISVVDTVVNIAFIIFAGLSSAIAILIGKTLGAGKIEEAKSNAVKLIVFGVIVGIVISSILAICAVFVPNLYDFDAEINQTIIRLLRIKAILLPIYVVNVCCFFTLRAGGETLNTMIMDSGCLWGFTVLTAILLSNFTTLPLITVYACVEAMEILRMLVALYFFKKGKWANNLTESHSNV
ncbi:MAG: MATE family efflux transporter [Clostridia bacterium]